MILQATIAQALGDTANNSQVMVDLTENVTEKMNLLDMAMKGGWIMAVLLVLSVICVYIFVERIMAFRKASLKDPHFMERVNDYVKNGELKSAVIYCQASNTPFSRIVEKGLQMVGRSRADLLAGMENAGNVEVAKLEKGLSGMATIAGGAPMIGFLGTVIGMVRAFWEMANAGNNIDVSLLSSGIYQAMITTVGGLIVGIIAMFAYNYLTSKVDHISNELESFIQDFASSAAGE